VTVDGHGQSGGVEAGEPDDRWYLRDEREFLVRSLHDAELEHAAGDLSDDDRQVLVQRDTTRLAEVEAALAALGPAEPKSSPGPSPGAPPTPPLPRWRRVAIGACCLLIAAGAVILVAHAIHPRQPGGTLTGGITLSQAQLIEQQLDQAQTLSNQNHVLSALELYDKVLSEDPTNPVALASAGWLKWNAGFSAHVAALTAEGRSEVEDVVRQTPSLYLGHLFYGLILANQDDNDAGAVSQFDQFVHDDPPVTVVASALPLVEPAYRLAGVALPATFRTDASATSGTSAP
jgi:hypothetical protein